MLERTCKTKKSTGVVPTLPYYLHASDHHSMNICPVILKGNNYQEWKKNTHNAFCAKRKLGFLDGVVKEPKGVASAVGVANAVQSIASSLVNSASAPVVLTSQDYNTLKPAFTDDQWNTVLAMFNSSNT